MVYFHPLTKAACKKTTPPYIGYVDPWPDAWPYRLGSIPGARSDILSNDRKSASRCSADANLRAIVRKEPQ
jgi:hypothetical protein